MAWEAIVKSEQDWKVIPNLRDYCQTCASFSWQQARRELDGLPGASRSYTSRRSEH